MQIRSQATLVEVQEAVVLSRSRYFWLRFFAANWYASVVIVLVLVVTANRLINHESVKLGPSALMVVILAAFIAFSWYRWNTKVCRVLLAATSSIEALSLDNDGVRINLKTGTSTFLPWSSFTKWVEGGSIFLLTGKDATTILPTDDGNRNAIRSLLSNSLP